MKFFLIAIQLFVTEPNMQPVTYTFSMLEPKAYQNFEECQSENKKFVINDIIMSEFKGKEPYVKFLVKCIETNQIES